MPRAAAATERGGQPEQAAGREGPAAQEQFRAVDHERRHHQVRLPVGHHVHDEPAGRGRAQPDDDVVARARTRLARQPCPLSRQAPRTSTNAEARLSATQAAFASHAGRKVNGTARTRRTGGRRSRCPRRKCRCRPEGPGRRRGRPIPTRRTCGRTPAPRDRRGNSRTPGDTNGRCGRGLMRLRRKSCRYLRFDVSGHNLVSPNREQGLARLCSRVGLTGQIPFAVL